MFHIHFHLCFYILLQLIFLSSLKIQVHPLPHWILLDLHPSGTCLSLSFHSPPPFRDVHTSLLVVGVFCLLAFLFQPPLLVDDLGDGPANFSLFCIHDGVVMQLFFQRTGLGHLHPPPSHQRSPPLSHPPEGWWLGQSHYGIINTRNAYTFECNLCKFKL